MYTLNKRPFSFDEIVGQKSIVNDFKNRSVTKDFPEVMIFEGETGTGKTTLAFIVSALINDPNPIDRNGYFDPNPESPVSKSIREETFNRDVYFFDGSSMGKSEIQDLSRLVQLAPQRDPKKVIIIDEAQELSKAGKGATLKLLEKKRKHVHIILCTMNMKAFDKAIRDRGQMYKFRPLLSQEIAQYLFGILQDEGALEAVPEEFITEGLFTIAQNCGGSMRSALQSLERALNGDIYTEEELSKEFGFIREETLNDLVLGLVNMDPGIFKKIRAIDQEEFFYKSMAIFTDAYEFYFEGSIQPEWKAKMLSQISTKIRNVTEIMSKVYQPILQQSYFNKNMFLSMLGSFIQESTEKPILSPTPKRKPVKRSPV